MREAMFEDELGRRWAVLLPDRLPDREANLFPPIGPPSLEGLGLPRDLEVRLHNELYARRIFSLSEAKARKMDIFAALQHAFRVDIGRILELYYNGSENKQETDAGSRMKEG